MAFERKTAAATTTAATASAATSKKSNKESAAVWVNFQVVLQTKKGARKISSGIAADSLFKRVFGEDFKEILESLNEEQLSNVVNSIAFENVAINIVTPSEEASYEDLF